MYMPLISRSTIESFGDWIDDQADTQMVIETHLEHLSEENPAVHECLMFLYSEGASLEYVLGMLHMYQLFSAQLAADQIPLALTDAMEDDGI